MSAEEKAPAELHRGEHARPQGGDDGRRIGAAPMSVVGEHGSALGHFFPRLAAGPDDGGLLLGPNGIGIAPQLFALEQTPGQPLKAHGLGGSHVAPPGQALIQVLLRDAGQVGNLLALRWSEAHGYAC